jgi:hypothetical protein
METCAATMRSTAATMEASASAACAAAAPSAAAPGFSLLEEERGPHQSCGQNGR